MNAKRILSLFLAAVLTLGVAVTPAVAASAASALPGSAALEAAMTTVPRLLMPAWMTMLDTENTAL